MDYIAIPLNTLMTLCYNWTGGYLPAIIVFTLLTKVILFPVSCWTQRNSIKMVEMMPALNELKIKYYGDRETIAEETQALYKKVHYSPLASTIPMIIQLVLLMGVIAAVKAMLGGDADSIYAQIPSQLGGVSLLMPLAAGLSALVLGMGQNRLNPLQKEQGRREQWMTNGISILISLSLGAFVTIGVCVYWIASNLLSVLNQLVLNAVIPPERYVDYEALRESRDKLAEYDSFDHGISKEDKKREKADYKRFFSVANKHLVFYSEKSGFYKYFRGVIEYLLVHSNIIIHYVTSDPRDQIFELAKVQPRIRPYYIGEKKLITLFMKMDADIVVMTMPDLDNFHIKRSYVRKDIEYIYICHGFGSTNLLLRTGALAHYDTILCVGEHQELELRKEEAVYGLKPRRLIECGYSLIDQVMAEYEQLPKSTNTRKQILIAPSWQADNIMDHAIDEILQSLLNGPMSSTIKVIVRPHPEYCKRYPQKIKAFQMKYADRLNDNFVLQLDFSSNETVFLSDLVITDWSTICYEYSFATKRPVLFINTPMKIMNPEYEKLEITPIDISCREEIGRSIELDELASVSDVAAELLNHSEEYGKKISSLVERCLYNPGRSSEAGGKYIVSSLLERQKKQ